MSTSFESISGKSPKEAGLSKKQAIDHEAKECSKALFAALSNANFREDIDENAKTDWRYSTIRKHINLLLSATDAIHTIYD